MSRQLIDLSRMTINQMSEITGSSFRTIKKRLAGLESVKTEGRQVFFETQKALRLIYLSNEAKEGSDIELELLDPQLQKARLDKARTEKVELEIDVLKGNLIPADQVERAWSDLIIAFRAKILSLHSKISPQLASLKTIPEIELKLKTELREALSELSNTDPSYKKESDDEDDAESNQ